MPPVFIQPGLGDSLNRYLERLARRGEEQRALQARRDNTQALVDARAAETRTRMISQSIDNTVGLFTNEMQRDRASERRIGEAEDLQYLRGRPPRQEANLGFGLAPRVHNGPLWLIDKETALGDHKARAFARLKDAPNTMTMPQRRIKVEVDEELQNIEKHLLEDPSDPEHQAAYVSHTIDQLSRLNFVPNGEPKKTLKPNTIIGNGFGPDNNGGVPGVTYNVHPETGEMKALELPNGLADALAEIRLDAQGRTTPEWDKWNKGDKKGEEPREGLTDKERSDFILNETATVMKQFQSVYGNNDPALFAGDVRGLSKFEVDEDAPAVAGATAEPDSASAFGGLTRKELDAKVKESGPVVLTDERGQPMIHPNKAGQPSTVVYMGNGRIGLIPRLGPSPIPSAPPESLDSLLRP